MEGSRLVLALPAIGTGRALTFVDVLLTPGPVKPGGVGSEWGEMTKVLFSFFTFSRLMRDFVTNV